jgi:hypothetical protein
MNARPVPTARDGPATHYELFAGLRDAGVRALVTGATALTLHGVPRLTPAVELAADPAPQNRERLERRLSAWGYAAPGTQPTAAGAELLRFRHPSAALEQIDVALPAAQEYARLAAGAARVALVDLDIALVGVADVRALRELAGEAGREDVAALDVLASVLAGDAGDAADTRREQIRKFSRWSTAARCDWLLAAARLSKGLAPEARPMTRGLVRRRGWYGR